MLALHKLNPDHPKCHELGGRFKLAVDNLPEPLPKQTQEVVQELYLSKLSPKSLAECNEEYLQLHSKSAAHVQSVVRFRNFLKPAAEETKSKGAKDLLATIDLPSTSLQDAQAGARILDEIKADKQPYLEAARQRWPQATAFKA